MYRLYIDEVGTDGQTNLQDDKHRYLSLTGVAMQIEHARDYLTPELNLIKAKVFKHDPDAPLIFHRKEILGFKGTYEMLRTDSVRAEFDEMILRLFKQAEYSVITVAIDKDWMWRQGHWQQKHPYHYLLRILLEKYVQFLERKKSIGDLMPESRQDKDELLQKEFSKLLLDGTDYLKPERILDSVRVKKLKFRKKPENVAGLQLCDLIAHPSHMYARLIKNHEVKLGPFSSQVSTILVNSKYDRAYYGKIIGYGIKWFP